MAGCRLPSHHFLHLAIFLGLAALYLGLIGTLFFFPPHLVSVATVVTERLDVTIGDGAKAAFPVDGLKMARRGAEDSASCVRGLLTPAPGTELHLSRVGEGALEIELFRPAALGPGATALLSPPDAEERKLDGMLYFASGLCPAGSPVRAADLQIPVWGHLVIGQEFRPGTLGGPREGSMLIEGHLQVMAASIISFFPKLYPVADLTLPVGARLEALGTEPHPGPVQRWLARWRRDVPAGDLANWWGIVYPDPQHPALIGQLATDARGLVLYLPNASAGQEIRISVLEELFTDPNLVWLHFFAGALFVFGQIAGFLAQWAHASRERRRP